MREPISKKLRFEVFKRDAFTCQYCGKSSPEVVLHVDHIKPVSKNGKNDILNLITSCSDCNFGKSNIKLSDKTILIKQRKQLKELSEKREQFELLIKWREELGKLEKRKVKYCQKQFEDMARCTLTGIGVDNLIKWITKYGEKEVLESIKLSGPYLIYDTNDPNTYTQESRNKAFNYIPRICECRKKGIDTPEMKEIFYIRGILRKRIGEVYNSYKTIDEIKLAIKNGIPVNDIKESALKCRSWKNFITLLYPPDEA